MRMKTIAILAVILVACVSLTAEQAQRTPPPSTLRAPTRAEILRGEYGRYRANNDLVHYDLDVRVDPDKKWISGRNTVRFKMLKDDTRIQLDLFANFTIDRIVTTDNAADGAEIHARPQHRLHRFPADAALGPHLLDRLSLLRPAAGDWPLRRARIQEGSDGRPLDQHRERRCRIGGVVAQQGLVARRARGHGHPRRRFPNDLVNVSNGRFIEKTDLGDGYTKWHYRVHYPINSYNVSLNIGHYVHFGEQMGDLTLDYYVLPGSLEKAKAQFAQAKPMIEAFEKYFGEYPFKKDGFKLIEVPYSGMEHQSAVTYGNRFANGYLERDWTGVGISLKFDFIIIHESAHEWFGNAVSAADQADMWIHEGWATYLECLYVEHMFGYDDYVKYTNGYKTKIANAEPIIVQRGIARDPNQDMYFKGALFLHTLRSVVNDDAKWFKLHARSLRRVQVQEQLHRRDRGVRQQSSSART